MTFLHSLTTLEWVWLVLAILGLLAITGIQNQLNKLRKMASDLDELKQIRLLLIPSAEASHLSSISRALDSIYDEVRAIRQSLVSQS